MSEHVVFPTHPFSPNGTTVVMYYLDANGFWQPVVGTPSAGMVPVYQANGSVAWQAQSGGSGGDLLLEDGDVIYEDGNPVVES